MTASDITEQVKQVYGVDVSEGMISNVINRIIEHVKEWQHRPLESIYYTIWMDGIVLRSNRVESLSINEFIWLLVLKMTA